MKLKYQLTNIRYAVISTFLMIVVIGGTLCYPCSVPVYRYALENWAPDTYIVVVVTDKALEGDLALTLETLQEGAKKTNYKVVELDVKTSSNTALVNILKDYNKHPLPLMMLFIFDTTSKKNLIWSGEFNDTNVRRLIDSPVRQTVAQEIIKGQSAIWVFIDSGNKTEDEIAFSTLKTELSQSAKILTLPQQEQFIAGQPAAEDDWVDPNILRISFPLERISHSDKAEEIFTAMLIRSEPDLAEYSNQPMAFPIFGRGRALYALVGKGINKENVFEANRFLIGACSCKAKELCQGRDLLISANWNMMIGDSQLPDMESLFLTGLPEDNTKIDSNSDLGLQQNPIDQQKNPLNNNTVAAKGLYKNIAIFVMGAIVAATLMTIILWRIKRSSLGN